MAVKFYTVIVEKSKSGELFAFFPDVPGCATCGENLQECLINAGVVLDEFFRENKIKDAPAPTPYEDVVVDDGVVVYAKSLVRYRDPEQTIRTAISIDKGLLRDIDAATNNRSGFLASAAHEKLMRM